MQFGSTIGKACLTFVITNIDDAFVLVTFFAESSTSRDLTPWKITIGQYIGFTVIVTISMIGFAVAIALPSKPIGFLGLLPILLGVWKFLELVIPKKDDIQHAEAETNRIASAKSIFKVAGITIMNGGDNIGTYIPLFSQAQGAEIAVYVVVYYILLGVWCLLAFLVMKQKPILRVCEKYAAYVIPFLYVGLGIYITVKSDCYPWSIDEINDQFLGNPGQTVMGVVTGVMMTFIIGVFVWIRLRKRSMPRTGEGEIALGENSPTAAQNEDPDNKPTSTDGKQGDCSSIQPVIASEVPREDAISIDAVPKLQPEDDHLPQSSAKDDK